MNARNKRFKLSGTAIDQPAIDRMRSQWESLLAEEMERKGYVRNYDHDPVFNVTKDGMTLAWELYIQGEYVGKRAKELAGTANGRSIPKGKSKRLSKPAA